MAKTTFYDYDGYPAYKRQGQVPVVVYPTGPKPMQSHLKWFNEASEIDRATFEKMTKVQAEAAPKTGGIQ